jgi:hypothetical protein
MPSWAYRPRAQRRPRHGAAGLVAHLQQHVLAERFLQLPERLVRCRAERDPALNQVGEVERVGQDHCGDAAGTPAVVEHVVAGRTP